MKITMDEVRHIADLSKLALSEEETVTFGNQLNTILGHVEQLGKLNTAGVGPTSHVIPLKNVMRYDIPAGSLSPEDALRNAPDATEQFYRVPKIIE